MAQDPYLDPAWAILKNKVRARTQSELDAAEVALVHVRTLELAAQPVQGSFDLPHLQAIHRYLFQDVYPFAGELRTLDIHKADDPSGGFMPVSRLRDASTHVFSELAEEVYLRGLDTDTYVGRLGHYLDEVNTFTRSAKAMAGHNGSSSLSLPARPATRSTGPS